MARKRKTKMTPRQRLTKKQIDFYLGIAAETVKEVERQLENSFGIPRGLIDLRIRGQI